MAQLSAERLDFVLDRLVLHRSLLSINTCSISNAKSFFVCVSGDVNFQDRLA